MEGISTAADSASHPSPTRAPKPKLLKACRRCARLKMKCDNREHFPCTRCHKARVDCRVDPTGRQANIDIESADRQRMVELASEVESLRKEVETLRQHGRQDDFDRQPPDMTRQNDAIGDDIAQHQTNFNELTADEMAAPIAAVDTMVSNSNDANSVSPANIRQHLHAQDLISKGVISEERARILYDMFLGGSRPYVPIFDPVMDNFDSLRSRSTYCFTVVMMLAVQRSAETREDIQLLLQFQNEARRLAGETLFHDPAKVESVQGMFLHAAYSEKTWFARGHALQMAVDLDFHTVFKDLRRSSPGNRDSALLMNKDRILISKARTWMAIYSMEQEGASGTSRLARSNAMDQEDLQDFIDHPLSEPQDIRLAGVVELNWLRREDIHQPPFLLQLIKAEKYRQRIENLNPPECLAMIEATDAFSELYSWQERWDKIFTCHGFDRNSFQRSSLNLQLNYIKIFILCSVLGKLQKERLITVRSERDEPEVRDAISRLLSVMGSQLSQFLNNPAYKWQLKWGPSYSVITIAFTAVFALKIARLRPELTDMTSLLDKCRQVAQILQKIPYTSFYRVLALLIALPLNQPLGITSGTESAETQQVPYENNLKKFRSIWYEGENHDQNSSASGQAQPGLVGNDGSMNETEAPSRNTNANWQPIMDEAMLRTLMNTPDLGAQTQQTGGVLQAPSWMLTDASMEGFGFPDEGEASFFDFDLMWATDQP